MHQLKDLEHAARPPRQIWNSNSLLASFHQVSTMYTVPSLKALLFFVPRGFGGAGGAQERDTVPFSWAVRSASIMKLPLVHPTASVVVDVILLAFYAFGANDAQCF